MGCRQESVSIIAGLSAIPRTPSVYFLLSHDAAMMKVGKSLNPRKRIKDIRHMNPHRVSVMLTLPGYTQLEYWVHHQFAALRSHGEWFYYRGDLVEFVAGLKSGALLIGDLCPRVIESDQREILAMNEQHQEDE